MNYIERSKKGAYTLVHTFLKIDGKWYDAVHEIGEDLE